MGLAFLGIIILVFVVFIRMRSGVSGPYFPFRDDIIEACSSKGVPGGVMSCIMDWESNGFNPLAYNPDDPTGAWGLGQLLLRTARGLGFDGPGEDLLDPDTNIYWSTEYLLELKNAGCSVPRDFFKCWNGGEDELYREDNAAAVSYADRRLSEYYSKNYYLFD